MVNWDLIPNNAIASMQLLPGSNPVFGLNTLGGALAINMKDGFATPVRASRSTAARSGAPRGRADAGGDAGRIRLLRRRRGAPRRRLARSFGHAHRPAVLRGRLRAARDQSTLAAFLRRQYLKARRRCRFRCWPSAAAVYVAGHDATTASRSSARNGTHRSSPATVAGRQRVLPQAPHQRSQQQRQRRLRSARRPSRPSTFLSAATTRAWGGSLEATAARRSPAQRTRWSLGAASTPAPRTSCSRGSRRPSSATATPSASDRSRWAPTSTRVRYRWRLTRRIRWR